MKPHSITYRISKSADRGLGDKLARFFKRIGIVKKEGCGCDGRQAWLNKLFPYTTVRMKKFNGQIN